MEQVVAGSRWNPYLSQNDSLWCITAGLVNWGGIVAMLMVAGQSFFQVYPAVFSPFGCLMILLLGVFYIIYGIRAIQSYEFLLAFFIIKLAYFLSWIELLNSQWADIQRMAILTPMQGGFFIMYGPIDLMFALGFLFIYFRHQK